jgi:CrcB protein
VNIIGSFLIGILVAIFITYTPSNELKAFLITGFLGAFTTYSTFAFESFELFNTSFSLAIFNILLNVIGTILSVAIGYKLVLYFLR